MERITTKAGDPLGITLPMQTTGFDWKVRQPVSTIEAVGVEAVPSEAFGGTGKTTFSFICHEPGTFELVFDYKRPWESSPQDETKRYEIVVE